MDAQTNTDLIQRLYDAVGRGDIPTVLDHMSDDVTWTLQGPATIPFAGTRQGHDGVAEFFTLVADHLAFEQFEPVELVAQGDTVVAIGVERSQVKVTGTTLEQEWVHVYTLRDGKVTRFRAFEDTAALGDAFGAS